MNDIDIGTEQLALAALGSIYLRVRKLKPFLSMSPTAREECTKLARKIQKKLDSKCGERTEGEPGLRKTSSQT